MREQLHSQTLGTGVSSSSIQTQERINQLTQFFTNRGADPITAHNEALKAIANVVRREAYVMAYNDCSYFIGMALGMCDRFTLL